MRIILLGVEKLAELIRCCKPKENMHLKVQYISWNQLVCVHNNCVRTTATSEAYGNTSPSNKYTELLHNNTD